MFALKLLFVLYLVVTVVCIIVEAVSAMRARRRHEQDVSVKPLDQGFVDTIVSTPQELHVMTRKGWKKFPTSKE